MAHDPISQMCSTINPLVNLHHFHPCSTTYKLNPRILHRSSPMIKLTSTHTHMLTHMLMWSHTHSMNHYQEHIKHQAYTSKINHMHTSTCYQDLEKIKEQLHCSYSWANPLTKDLLHWHAKARIIVRSSLPSNEGILFGLK